MTPFNIEQTWYSDDSDDEIKVAASWIYPQCVSNKQVSIKIPIANVQILTTHRQAKEFAENLMSAVMGLPSKDELYAGDKTKGDAFEILRRAEQ